uniref:MARVEL domain-containing protein n=1 Tax=Scylla olivacea TaxID=85551 RepID=A0A0P4WCF4_SCYOL
MSTQVTVHRMVTTTTTSAFLINVGYLKTFPGILKIFQILLGCVVVGITGHYIHWSTHSEQMVPELFFLLIATTCLITTSLLLFSCLCSIATASIIPKTLFVVLLHGTLSYLLVCASINLLREVVARNEKYKIYERGYNSKIFSGALGLVNCALYILSSVYSIRTFRRG